MDGREKLPYEEKVAKEIIEALEKGTAPWIKPWKGEDLRRMAPFNPTTGKQYEGMNFVNLSMKTMMTGDPRWMTYKQAATLGGQVRKGEKGTLIQYWKFSEQIDKKDENGKKVLDENGKPEKITVQLEHPKRFFATVFNGSQIDNLPELEKDLEDKEQLTDFKPIEVAEEILKNSGAIINYKNGYGAFYSPDTDEITMSHKEQFNSEMSYYATALHELGHWTGHESRLDRDLSNPFGSIGYAKEELRAEIGSFMISSQLGLDYDPSNHHAYIKSWVKILEDTPKEIFNASRDAGKIVTFVKSLQHKQSISQTQTQTKDQSMADHKLPSEPLSQATEQIKANHEKLIERDKKSEQNEKAAVFEEKTYLAVPYREKDQAKKAGAKWDKDQKSWYAPEGASKEALRDWTIENKEIKALDQNQDKFLDAVSEFKAALEERGLKISGDPIMDGEIHRVPVEGDKGKKLSGAYMAYNDGRPAGYIENFKTGIKENWKAMGSNFSNNLTPEKIAEQKALNEAKEAQRAKDLEDKYAAISEKVSNEFGSLKEAPNDHAYLKTKGVKAHGLKLDEKNNLVMPLKDLNGKQWTAQKINSNFKGLEKGGKKAGHFHIIGANDVKDMKEVIIVEGYATGASIYEATGTPVVVAVDSGNLKPVAEAIRDKYPELPMVIAGDNDIQKELKAKSATEKAKANVGKIKAAAAAACNAFSIIPQLTQEEIKAGVTDFNDLSKSRGPKEVKKIIDVALNQAKSKIQTIQKEAAKAKNLDQNKKNQREVVRKQTIGMSR